MSNKAEYCCSLHLHLLVGCEDEQRVVGDAQSVKQINDATHAAIQKEERVTEEASARRSCKVAGKTECCITEAHLQGFPLLSPRVFFTTHLEAHRGQIVGHGCGDWQSRRKTAPGGPWHL